MPGGIRSRNLPGRTAEQQIVRVRAQFWQSINCGSHESAPLRLRQVSLAGLLCKPLDKATRMSDWSKRPLTPRQVTYAALDAWVLVELMRTLRENHAEELERLAGGLTHVRE